MDKTLQQILEKLKEEGKGDGGFFDLPQSKICNHPEHYPPNHICIPQGKGYRHVCPSCGKVTVIVPQQFTL